MNFTRAFSILALAAVTMFVGACAEQPEIEEPQLGEEVETGIDESTVTEVNYFTDWDLDDDGFLTTDEFVAGADTSTWWEDWDVDEDTYLNESEFGTEFGDYGWYDAELYDEWDVDDDELLSADEWETGLFEDWDADEDDLLAENEYDPGLFE